MIERDGEVEDELHEMQLALDALDHAIDEVRTQIQRERGIDAAHEQARHLSAVDTRLEKRRAHALLALNQTDTKVRELRSQSDQTSRETAFLAGLHAQLAKDRKARWAAIGEVLRRALTIVDARALSRATLVAAQGELQRDFEQFERHWIVLCDVIESERLQRQMFARYSDFYAAKVEGQLSREVRPRNYLVAGVACTDLSKSNPSVLKGEQAMRRKVRGAAPGAHCP